MEFNCDERGDCSYDYRNVGNLGGGFGEEDDFLNRMSFSGYDTVNCVGNVNGNDSLFNDFLGFGEVTGNSLPEDPFCMNVRSTLNKISDWFYENQIDLLVSDSYDVPIGGGVVDRTMLQQQISSFKRNDFEGLGDEEVSFPEDPFCMKDWFHENQKGLVDEQIGVVDQMLFESLSWFHNPASSISQQQIRSNDLDDDYDDDDDDDAGEPHCAFELVVPYLELKEILAVEGVCRSLRDSIRKEPFFWRNIDLSFSFRQERVTDDSLLKLTRRAQGNLQCLNLGGCSEISDYGLKQVLAINPHLTKVSVWGCLRLSTAGLLSTLRDLKSSNRLGVKSLITGGALYFTKEQFKELNLLLGADAKASPKPKKQRFYTFRRSDLSLEDDRVTDLEICPWCEKPSLVFDCPAETCVLKDFPCPKSLCRACVVCIERCHECGKCLNDCENKPFCFAFICVRCYKKRSNQL